VDWDGAIASGREVARFGAELWERLNGKEEEEGLPSLSELFGQVTIHFSNIMTMMTWTCLAKVPAKTTETEEIKSLAGIVNEKKQDVLDALKKRDDLREMLR
jgi:hypothetical protein